MKKSLIKNNLKAISKTRRRFLSILVMAFLGVGFYAGLVATSPDILDSLDKYTDESKLFDIDIVSTLGLTEEDIEAIKQIEGVEAAYGIQTKDSVAQLNEKESICKVIEYNENINVPTLLAGSLPQNPNECLLDEGYFLADNYEEFIGKTLTLENEDKDVDDNPVFTQKELKIVGIAASPNYISNERGNTSIGSGNISFYIYTQDSVINMDCYTEICGTVEGAEKEVTNSKAYLALVEPVYQKIEGIKQEREEARYNQLVEEATTKLADAQKEFDNKKQEVEDKFADAQAQIDKAKQEISDSENELNKSEKELQSQERSSQRKFKDAEKQIQEAEEQINTKSQELEQAKQELENSKAQVAVAIEQLAEGITKANANIKTLQEQKKELEQNGLDTTQIDEYISQAQATLQSLETQKAGLENQIKTAKEQIESGEAQLNSARTELETQKANLASGKKTANRQIANAKAQITSGKAKLEDGKAEIADKEKELEDARKEADTELAEAQQKLNDAKDEIGKIEKAKWYMQDRLDNTGYSNIFDAIKTMSNIATIFPVVFYLVAVLISLTSMTRMIEEERIEIGTLKSLGYTNFQIIMKYVLYAFLACVIGGILGMTLGFYLLPNIVWSLYSSLYTLPNFYLSYRISIGIIGILLAFACIGGATILVAYKELKQMPAVLMRPKPPKSGKRILLERITFIWKKLNFSQKVTIRNIFRYKKRAIMTVVGIAGCTGLMLTGFGIKDSIIDIPTSQFGGVFQYEASISLQNTNGLDEQKNNKEQNENIESYAEICATTGKLKNADNNYDVTIFIPENEAEFEKVCNLTSFESGEKIKLSDNGIVITDKVAEMLNVKVGDEITLIDSDDIEYTFKVDSIAQNYVMHYAYMSKTFYETNIKSYKTNMMLVNTKDISEEARNQISEGLLNIEGVASVSVLSSMMQAIHSVLSTIDYVVVILIVASALLAFVVLYNLANINIGERQREIATLKVLGFYDKEVDNYINKENIIFTIIGVALGLVFGVFLTNAIIASVEIDKLRFIRNIAPLSYVYAATITVLFSLIVNWVVHFVLKKINMIQSLKSVE